MRGLLKRSCCIQMTTWMKIGNSFEIPRIRVIASTSGWLFLWFQEKTVADAFLECKCLYNWPAVGWIGGEVVKRNIEHSLKIASAMVHFFVFYNHDDDTSKRVINLSNNNKWFWGSSLYYCDLGTHGAEKGIRETRVEWMVFDYIFSSGFWFEHIVTTPLTSHPLRNWGLLRQVTM